MGVADASITWSEGAPVKCDCCMGWPRSTRRFDDPNLVSRAGLVALAGEQVAIAGRCGVNPHLKAFHIGLLRHPSATGTSPLAPARGSHPTADKHARNAAIEDVSLRRVCGIFIHPCCDPCAAAHAPS